MQNDRPVYGWASGRPGPALTLKQGFTDGRFAVPVRFISPPSAGERVYREVEQLLRQLFGDLAKGFEAKPR